MERRIILISLLTAVTGCERACGKEPTAAPEDAAPVDASSTTAASTKPPASASASASAVASSGVSELETTSCPAPIARACIENCFGGIVELVACPDEEKAKHLRRVNGKSLLRLRGNSDMDTRTDEVILGESEHSSASIALNDLYGTGRPVIFTTFTEPTMGSWSGPTTTLYEVDKGRFKLESVRAVGADGGAGEAIVLVSSIRKQWWLHAARSGKGLDIYEVRTSADNQSVGYRYAFEKDKWLVRSRPLAKWTGEHQPDTEAEFF